MTDDGRPERPRARHRRRRRLRRRGLRDPARPPPRGRRHPRRPQRLPPVPAAPLPGRDVPAGCRRRRLPAAPDQRRPRRLRGQAGGGRGDRPRLPDRDPDDRRHVDGRHPRPGGRVAAVLLQDPGCCRACLPALLAGRRQAPAIADPAALRGGGPRPGTHRRRCTRVRGRRRWPDRGGGLGRPRRDDRDHPRDRVPAPRRRAGPGSAWSTTVMPSWRRSRPAPTSTRPTFSPATASGFGSVPASPRSAPGT